jgi:4-hydroxy-tetrahydrodipicolinate synthase
MPACQSTEIHVAIWDKLEADDEAGARQLFNQLLPLISFERMHGVAIYKEVLKRRGIFRTTVSRAPGRSLDEMDLKELDAILADIEPLFTI